MGAKTRTKGKKRSSETEDLEKQCLATLKRFKQGDENELERKLRLENMVATKWLRLAMEMDKERKERLDKVVASKRLRLTVEMEEERRARRKEAMPLFLRFVLLSLVLAVLCALT